VLASLFEKVVGFDPGRVTRRKDAPMPRLYVPHCKALGGEEHVS